MSKNSILQLLILFSIILASVFVYQRFFISKPYVETSKDASQKKQIISANEALEDNLSIIESLEYRSFDSLGNEYIIKAKKAQNTPDNINLLYLREVSGFINLINKPPIKIKSKFATHNKENFNTKFFKSVLITHDNVKVTSDNLDLIYDKNLVDLYNISEVLYDDSVLKADKIVFDMLTKDISINMYNNDKKIDFVYKSYGNN